jgi:hypothetical protein
VANDNRPIVNYFLSDPYFFTTSNIIVMGNYTIVAINKQAANITWNVDLIKDLLF